MECRAQFASAAIDELDKGDFELASKLLTTSILSDPDNYEHYFERSVCQYKLANYQASLDDANAAIRVYEANAALRMNSQGNNNHHHLHHQPQASSTDNVYNIHYQKGLALIGLALFSEAVASFKKAIELRAKQDDSKLSDIFKLLRDATNELNTARRRPQNATARNGTNTITNTATNNTAPSNEIITANTNISNNNNNNNNNNASFKQAPVTPMGATPTKASQNQTMILNRATTKNTDPVDSTTDKPSPPVAIAQMISLPPTPAKTPATDQQTIHAGLSPTSVLMENGTSNLVATSNNRNSNQNLGANQILKNESSNHSLAITSATTTATTTNRVSSSANQQHQQQQPPQEILFPSGEPTKAPSATGSFDWNIRRSERIFLHNSSEPGTSGPNDETASQPRARLNSNPSSVSSSANKRSHARANNDTRPPAYHIHQHHHQSVRNGTNSVLDSEIDVDDSSTTYSNLDDPGSAHKRVMVTPSSSMPATSQQAMTAASSKEDSYSSKYKRLRRDRERARRGTSKLCIIKPSDLDELHKKSQYNSEKRFMRVIAPIDGWLYAGSLSFDDSSQNGDDTDEDSPLYVVKLDDDPSGRSYMFKKKDVLNDVIKEVFVKSVSELRKGARICCYWNRTLKCMSTGVVTSRTFEENKSLVSIKFDNGDLSSLALKDIRLIPPDYPKYMSNNDPLLLADGETEDPLASPSKSSARIVVDCKTSQHHQPDNNATYSKTTTNSAAASEVSPQCLATLTPQQVLANQEARATHSDDHLCDIANQNGLPTVESMRSALEDDTLLPTSETINFISNDRNLGTHDEDHMVPMNTSEHPGVVTIKDTIMTTNETTTTIDPSRASSEENNYSIEYRPWVFEGPSKRIKRSGRTYRDVYSAIRRGDEVIRVGDSAELMPRDEKILPFIAKVDGLWATSRGEMQVRVRWYYRLVETEGEPRKLVDGENALFETHHFDDNDVQSIWRTVKILPWTDYAGAHIGHVNKHSDGPKIFYIAGDYNPVKKVKQLRPGVKRLQ